MTAIATNKSKITPINTGTSSFEVCFAGAGDSGILVGAGSGFVAGPWGMD
jgi:hypothetical protein